jgi:uncharacterized protein with PIN domain
MPTAPSSPEALSPEQKANRELAASLLDAHFNLAKSLGEAEAKLIARKDTAVREFAKANGVDAILAVSKNVASAIDQLEKDVAALKQSPKLVLECLERLEKSSPEIVKMVLTERKTRDEEELKKTDSGQLVFKKDLDFVNGELKKLTPAKNLANKKTHKKPARKPAAAKVATKATT